jgi:hypothetical protein
MKPAVYIARTAVNNTHVTMMNSVVSEQEQQQNRRRGGTTKVIGEIALAPLLSIDTTTRMDGTNELLSSIVPLSLSDSSGPMKIRMASSMQTPNRNEMKKISMSSCTSVGVDSVGDSHDIAAMVDQKEENMKRPTAKENTTDFWVKYPSRTRAPRQLGPSKRWPLLSGGRRQTAKADRERPKTDYAHRAFFLFFRDCD